MNQLIKPGRVIFACGVIGLGVLSLLSKDFVVGRPPAWPAGFDVNPILGYITGVLLILAALAIILNKRGAQAALFIATLIFLLSVLRHLPQFMNDWANAYKSMALLGGALIVASSFLKEDGVTIFGFNADENFQRAITKVGCVLLAAFFIACGYAHFKFAQFVEGFIPDYIPLRVFWTYFCGICLFAGGIGILIPKTKKWAAFLSGIMILGWFVLLHIPRFVFNLNDPSDRMGLCESFAFVGIFFVLAGVSSEHRK